MTRALLVSLTLLLLPAGALARDLPFEVLASGDNGRARAGLEELDTPEAIARWSPGLEKPEGRSLVGISLGEQPAGTRVKVSRVSSKDKYGWQVKVRLVASVPVRARETIHPFVVVAYPGGMFVDHELSVVVRLGDTRLIPMKPEDAATTRARLSAMSRRQRREVEKLVATNRALRKRVLELDLEILNFSESPEYVAADRALGFEEGMRRAVHMASFKTDLALFGSTLNPFIMEGDRSIKYLREGKKRGWVPSLKEDFAKEAVQIQEHIEELEGELAEMRSFAAKHSERTAESGGIAAGVDRN